MSNQEKVSIETNANLPEKPYVDRRKGLTIEENSVYNKYVEAYEKRKPEIDDFCDIYPEEEIKRDEERLEIEERKHTSPKTDHPIILEAILEKQIEQAEWFGKNCFVVPASRFDDVFNHTDLVIEFREKEDEIIRLAIDVTTNENNKDLHKKIEHTERDIKKGKLTTLKYYSFEEFGDTEESYKGKIEMVPRVILGTNNEGVKELCNLIANKKNIELSKSYIQIAFLEETKKQLEYYIRFAEREGYSSKSPVIANQEKVLNIINEVLENKRRSLGELPRGARNNGVYKYVDDLAA